MSFIFPFLSNDILNNYIFNNLVNLGLKHKSQISDPKSNRRFITLML